MKKEHLNKPQVIGGVGAKWGEKQFRNQYRVLNKNCVSYAINASALNGLYVKKWKSKKE